MERGAGPDLRRLIDELAAAVVANDVDAVRKMIAGDVVVEYPNRDPVFGAEENLAVLRELHALVGPSRQSVSDLVVGDDRCAFRVVVDGRYNWSGVVFVNVTDGLVTRAYIATER